MIRLICSAFVLVSFLAGVAVVYRPSTAVGCAVVVPGRADVEITDEAALIIWDSESRTEHFIRNANFVTNAQEFGFIVPTPTRPTLHESGGRVLSNLMKLTAPRIEYREKKEPAFRLFAPGTGFDLLFPVLPYRQEGAIAPNSAVPGAVQVIEELSVAGYDAAILKASDPDSLLEWLREHNYASRPELEDWVRDYTEQDWFLTAFRISAATDGHAGHAGHAVARPVRITFQTDRPFYPYREPAAGVRGETEGSVSEAASEAEVSPVKHRLLRLFVLADQRMQGTIGDSGPQPATTVWAGRLSQRDGEWIGDLLSGSTADKTTVVSGRTLYLTELEDHSTPRPGTDELHLKVSADQSLIERPVEVRFYTGYEYSPDLYQWPFILMGAGSVLLVLRGRGIRRRIFSLWGR